MKSICVALLLTLALTSARTSVAWQPSPEYNSMAELLSAAANEPQLNDISTLLAAVNAANFTVADKTPSTLFAPTNAAFESPDLKGRTGLTAAQFFETANKEALVKLLSYHVLPAEAVQFLPNSPASREGVKTALTNETLDITSGGRWGAFRVKDVTGTEATVQGPPYNVRAGKTMIHFMGKVLIPAALVKT